MLVGATLIRDWMSEPRSYVVTKVSAKQCAAVADDDRTWHREHIVRLADLDTGRSDWYTTEAAWAQGRYSQLQQERDAALREADRRQDYVKRFRQTWARHLTGREG